MVTVKEKRAKAVFRVVRFTKTYGAGQFSKVPLENKQWKTH